MPTTSSTTSLVAGGGDDLDDSRCHSGLPPPTGPDTDNIVPVIADVVLNVTSETSYSPSPAAPTLSARFRHIGALRLSGAFLCPFSLLRLTHASRTRLSPPQYLDNVLAGLGGAFWIKRRAGTPAHCFPRLNWARCDSHAHDRIPPLMDAALSSLPPDCAHCMRHRTWNQTAGGHLWDSFRAVTCFSQHPATPDTIPAPTDPVRRSFGSTAHKPSKTRLNLIVGIILAHRLNFTPSFFKTAFFKSIQFWLYRWIDFESFEILHSIDFKRSGGLWLLNFNLRSKLLAFENLDYELGDRPQEPLIIFKFWTPFRLPFTFIGEIIFNFGKGHHTHLTYCDGRRLGLLPSKSYFMILFNIELKAETTMNAESLDLLDSPHLRRFDSLPFQKPREYLQLTQGLWAVTIFKLNHGPLPRCNWLPFQRPTISSIMWWSYCIYKCMPRLWISSFRTKVGWSLKRLSSCLEVQVKSFEVDQLNYKHFTQRDWYGVIDLNQQRHINQACDRALLVRNHDHLLKRHEATDRSFTFE
ncbi:hypothetical protein C8R43DRAFT_1109555 [Mycena crocata]|nr:hypothetical protein C8R43DRAFT_1109555 [Mycena crocata]